MILALNALKCRSHSAEDAGITKFGHNQTIRDLFMLPPPVEGIKNITFSMTQYITAQSHNFGFPSIHGPSMMPQMLLQ